MGAYVGFEFCRRYPAQVRALVLTNTRAEADSAEAAQSRRETARRVQKERYEDRFDAGSGETKGFVLTLALEHP